MDDPFVAVAHLNGGQGVRVAVNRVFVIGDGWNGVIHWLGSETRVLDREITDREWAALAAHQLLGRPLC